MTLQLSQPQHYLSQTQLHVSQPQQYLSQTQLNVPQSQLLVSQPQLQITQPVVTQPVVTQPIVTQPIIQQLVQSEPAVVTQKVKTCMKCNGEPNRWSTGLFNCCGSDNDDCCICMLGTFCPCMAAYQLASEMGETTCCACLCCGLFALRAYFRGKYNVEGNLCTDCCVASWCCPCATCQMIREQRYF